MRNEDILSIEDLDIQLAYAVCEEPHELHTQLRELGLALDKVTGKKLETYIASHHPQTPPPDEATYADNSDSAKLARHILKNDPSIGEADFATTAKRLGEAQGLSKTSIDACIAEFAEF